MKEGGTNKDTREWSVLAFEKLTAEEEMNMFIDINSKQVKVKKSVRIELY